MGSLTSKLSILQPRVVELMTIIYAKKIGPPPEALELFPHGEISYFDTAEVVKAKVWHAVRKQKQLRRAIDADRQRNAPRCLSPFMLTKFEIPTGHQLEQVGGSRRLKMTRSRSPSSKLPVIKDRQTPLQADEAGLGTFSRLVSRNDFGETDAIASKPSGHPLERVDGSRCGARSRSKSRSPSSKLPVIKDRQTPLQADEAGLGTFSRLVSRNDFGETDAIASKPSGHPLERVDGSRCSARSHSKSRSPSSKLPVLQDRQTPLQADEDDLGAFIEFTTSRSDFGEVDTIMSKQDRTPQRCRRSNRTRSRPVPTAKVNWSERQAKSWSAIGESLSPIDEKISEEAFDETDIMTQLNKKPKRRQWPSSELIKSVLYNPKDKPTTFFLARFRKSLDSDYVEVEYRFNRLNQRDYFAVKKGNLESLLPAGEHFRYRNDKANNNVDDKTVFMHNVHSFFNYLHGRVWWNGFSIATDVTNASSLKVAAVEMDPPHILFDVSGLKNITATRTDARLNVNGYNGEGIMSRNFTIRGKPEDLKEVQVKHIAGSPRVGLALPIVSALPSTFSFMSQEKKTID